MIQQNYFARIIDGKYQNRIGVVTGNTFKNKLEIRIDTTSRYWCVPSSIEKIPFKTKLGDRIRITYVPGAIKNVLSGAIGTVVKEADIIYDRAKVSVQFNDGKIVVWDEDSLEVLAPVAAAICNEEF